MDNLDDMKSRLVGPSGRPLSEDVEELQRKLQDAVDTFAKLTFGDEGEKIANQFDKIAEHSKIGYVHMEKFHEGLGRIRDVAREIDPFKINDPKELQQNIDKFTQMNEIASNISKLADPKSGAGGTWLGKEDIKGVASTVDELSKSLAGVSYKHRELSDYVTLMSADWVKLRHTVKGIAEEDMLRMNQLMSQLSDKDKVREMTQEELNKKIREVEQLNFKIIPQLEKQKDLQVGSLEALRNYEATAETVSAQTEEKKGGRTTGPADVMRGISGIPGMEPLGMVANLLAGGLNIMTAIQAIGDIIKIQSQFIELARESRMAIQTPGVVAGEELGDKVRRGLELVFETHEIPQTAKDIDNWMKIVAQHSNELVFASKSGTMTWNQMLEVLNDANTRSEELKKAVEESKNVEWSEASMGAGGGLVDPGAAEWRKQLEQESKLLDSVIADGSKVMGEFMVQMQVLSSNMGMSQSQLMDMMNTFQRLSRSTESMTEDMRNSMARIVVFAKEGGVNTAEFVNWVQQAYTNTRFFSMDMVETTKIVGGWREELKSGEITMQDFNSALQRAMGIMTPEDFATEMVLMEKAIAEHGNSGIKAYEEELKKGGVLARMVNERLMREGAEAIGDIARELGPAGARVAADILKKAEAGGGIEEVRKEYFRVRDQYMMEPIGKGMGGGDYGMVYAQIGGVLNGFPSMWQKGIHETIVDLKLTLGPLQRTLEVEEEKITKYQEMLDKFTVAYKPAEQLMDLWRLVADWSAGGANVNVKTMPADMIDVLQKTREMLDKVVTTFGPITTKPAEQPKKGGIN